MSDDTAATSVLSTPASTDIFLDTASTDVAPAMTPKQAIAPVTEEEEVEGTPEAVVPDLEERASTPISLPPAIWAAGDVYHAEEMREATTATLPPGLAPASEPSPFDDDDKSDAVEGERTPEVASDIAQAPTPHFDEPSLALGVGAREEASAVDAQAISSKLPAFDPRVSPPSSPIKPLELDFSKTPVRAGHSNSSDELDTPSRDERRTTPRPLSATDLALQDMAYAAAAKASEQERREDDEAASTRRDSFETAERSPRASLNHLPNYSDGLTSAQLCPRRLSSPLTNAPTTTTINLLLSPPFFLHCACFGLFPLASPPHLVSPRTSVVYLGSSLSVQIHVSLCMNRLSLC